MHQHVSAQAAKETAAVVAQAAARDAVVLLAAGASTDLKSLNIETWLM